MKPLRIAFGHQARVGKDTACNHLVNRHGGVVLHFSDGLYRIAMGVQKELDKPMQKDPQLLQFLGEGLRGVYGENVWVDPLFASLKGIQGNVFVGDLRYKNEFLALKKAGFTLVKIEKKNRIIDRDPFHKSETDLAEQDFDYVIQNDDSIEDFYAKLNYLANSLRVK